MALLTPPELLGIHTNMPATVPDDIDRASSSATRRRLASPDEKHAFDQLDYFYKHGLGYAQEMANRPQTLYGIEDSPIGLAAWMLDHDAASQALIARVFDGQSEGLSRDDVLDNVTLYWLTNTGDLVGPPVLGKQAELLCAETRHDSGRRQRLSRRDLRRPAELGGASVSQTDPLQPPPQRRPLCRLGAAATFQKRFAQASGRCANSVPSAVTAPAGLWVGRV